MNNETLKRCLQDAIDAAQQCTKDVNRALYVGVALGFMDCLMSIDTTYDEREDVTTLLDLAYLSGINGLRVGRLK